MTVRELPSGLRLSVAEPVGTERCTIYALHGGGLSAAYWDCPSDPSLSLVRLATSAGCRVASLDRPGHGSNEAAWPGGLPAAEEAALHASAINDCWPGEPVFLLAQSAGSMVALRVAAAGLLPGLIGVEYSGVGIALDVSRIEGGLTLESFWGPLHLYPPATFSPGTRVTTPTTPHDGTAAQTWGDVFHQVAGLVRVPVRITMVDTEAWWGDVPTTLAAIAAASPTALRWRRTSSTRPATTCRSGCPLAPTTSACWRSQSAVCGAPRSPSGDPATSPSRTSPATLAQMSASR